MTPVAKSAAPVARHWIVELSFIREHSSDFVAILLATLGACLGIWVYEATLCGGTNGVERWLARVTGELRREHVRHVAEKGRALYLLQAKLQTTSGTGVSLAVVDDAANGWLASVAHWLRFEEMLRGWLWRARYLHLLLMLHVLTGLAALAIKIYWPEWFPPVVAAAMGVLVLAIWIGFPLLAIAKKHGGPHPDDAKPRP